MLRARGRGHFPPPLQGQQRFVPAGITERALHVVVHVAVPVGRSHPAGGHQTVDELPDQPLRGRRIPRMGFDAGGLPVPGPLRAGRLGPAEGGAGAGGIDLVELIVQEVAQRLLRILGRRRECAEDALILCEGLQDFRLRLILLKDVLVVAAHQQVVALGGLAIQAQGLPSPANRVQGLLAQAAAQVGAEGRIRLAFLARPEVGAGPVGIQFPPLVLDLAQEFHVRGGLDHFPAEGAGRLDLVDLSVALFEAGLVPVRRHGQGRQSQEAGQDEMPHGDPLPSGSSAIPARSIEVES